MRNTLCPYFSRDSAESLYFQGKFLKKVCVTGLTLSGTGKTYASAFALREIKPQKVLFVVHREKIAKQALMSYKKVFGGQREDGAAYRYALLSGNTSNEIEEIKTADLVFATMQMMRKDSILNEFASDTFSVICLDEYGIIGQVRRRPILKAS